jgi:hypothetical protein
MPVDYVRYYDLETYLFEDVHRRFHQDKCLNAFDLFSIIIWKANRSKSKLASRLIRKYPKLKPAQALEKAATSFTNALATAKTHEGRLLLAIGDWKFRLPMASAILTVLWPEDFTVYDYRVCEELLQGELGNFRWLSDKAANHKLWLRYCDYLGAVKKAVPSVTRLREKDMYLWGKSAANQLEIDIEDGFPKRT